MVQIKRWNIKIALEYSGRIYTQCLVPIKHFPSRRQILLIT